MGPGDPATNELCNKYLAKYLLGLRKVICKRGIRIPPLGVVLRIAQVNTGSKAFKTVSGSIYISKLPSNVCYPVRQGPQLCHTCCV